MTPDEEWTKRSTAARKDGGCGGWTVVVGSFTVHVLLNGVAFTYGVIVPSLVDHFDCGRAIVGGVSSLMIGLSWIAGASIARARRQVPWRIFIARRMCV